MCTRKNKRTETGLAQFDRMTEIISDCVTKSILSDSVLLIHRKMYTPYFSDEQMARFSSSVQRARLGQLV